jgi:vacuolar protein sorting-associated protein 53
LSKAGQTLIVKVLLETLQQTTDFELSTAKKWATPVRFSPVEMGILEG